MQQSWQEQTCSVTERDSHIWTSSKWTDCIFHVGPQRKQFCCHRVYLAKTSPVFEAMLFGDLFVSAIPIIIPDIEPDAFHAMLQYIYEGCAIVSNFNTCCALLCAAKKYTLPLNMLEDCRAMLWSMIYPSHAWPALVFATQNYEEEIYDTAVEVIQKSGSTCFAQENLLQVPHSILLSFLQNHGGIKVQSESEIFSASLRWARHQVTLNCEPETLQNLRQVLGDILQNINFKELQLLEFSEILESVPENDTVPRVAEKYDSYFIFGKSNSPVVIEADKDLFKSNTYDLFTKITFPTMIGKVKCFKLLGIRLSTQVASDVSSATYEEDLTVHVYTGTRSLVSTRFTMFVQYDTAVNIQLSRQVVVDCYPYVSIAVIPHVTGRYPAQCVMYNTAWKCKGGYFDGHSDALFLYCQDCVIMPILIE